FWGVSVSRIVNIRADDLDAREPYLPSAARARCPSIRWRQSAYSLVPARYSNDLHHSSSESSRGIDEQLPSTSAASRNANLGIMATSALKRRTNDPGPDHITMRRVS